MRSAAGKWDLALCLSVDARSEPWRYGIVMYLMPLISPRSMSPDYVFMRDLPRQHQLLLEAPLHVPRCHRIEVRFRPYDLQCDRHPDSASHTWYTAPVPPTPSARMMW